MMIVGKIMKAHWLLSIFIRITIHQHEQLPLSLSYISSYQALCVQSTKIPWKDQHLVSTVVNHFCVTSTWDTNPYPCTWGLFAWSYSLYAFRDLQSMRNKWTDDITQDLLPIRNIYLDTIVPQHIKQVIISLTKIYTVVRFIHGESSFVSPCMNCLPLKWNKMR